MDLRKGRFLILTPLLAAMSWASAEESTGLLSCASYEDDTRRLLCYDTEIARLMRDGTTIPVVSTRIEKARLVDEFGMRGEMLRKALEKRQRENPRLEKLEATVSSIAKTPDGRLLVELDNGQQWEQTQGKSVPFLKVGDGVFFTRGTLGSFFLNTEQHRSVRVRRVR